jgi:hypothetical protein
MTTRTRVFTPKLPAVVALAVAAVLTVAFTGAGQARAATAPVGLGTATTFAVLGGRGIANTGPSVISGDIGVGSNSAITGFGPAAVNGVQHVADAGAFQAETDVATAYNDAAGRTPVTSVPAELGGTTLFPGVYASGPLAITGTVTLDARNASDAVFVLQADTLTTAVNSTVVLTNGANACNVFWQVTRPASLGKNSVFAGTILALTSIAAGTGATIDGRLLAPNGTVKLHHDTITASICAVTPAGTTTTVPSTTTTGPTTTTTLVSGTTTTVPSTTTTVPSTTTTVPSTTTTVPSTTTTAPSAGHLGRATASGAVGAASDISTTTLPASTTSTTEPGSTAPGIFPTTTTAGVSGSATSTTDPTRAVALAGNPLTGTGQPLAGTGANVARTLGAALLAIALGAAVVWGSSRSRSRRRT